MEGRPSNLDLLFQKKRKSYKRPSNNPTFMPNLRIFRTDVRRRYVEMIMNVLNAHDVDLLKQFHQEFSDPNITQIFSQFPQLLLNLTHPPQIQGIDLITKSYGWYYLLTPDIIFRFSDIQVCKSTGFSGSRIVAKSYTSGTMLYKFPLSQLSLLNSGNSSSIEPGENNTLLERLDSPIQVLIEAESIFTLDELHHIVSIEIRATNVPINVLSSL